VQERPARARRSLRVLAGHRETARNANP
jgi:hypothetical protein